MYNALLLLLLGIAIFLFTSGIKKRQKLKSLSGAVLGLLTVLFFWFMDFWGEALWYQNLGYGDRFWVINFANTGFAAAGAILGLIIIYLLTISISKNHKAVLGITKLLGLVIGGYWGYSNWEIILKYWNGVSTGLKDPILGKDVGFYLFTLPFYDSVFVLLLMLSLTVLISIIISSFIRLSENNIVFYFPNEFELNSNKFKSPLFLNSSIFVLILAAGRYLSRFHLMYSSTGVVAGPCWTDVNVLLPAYTVVILLLILISIGLLVPKIRKGIQFFFIRKFRIATDRSYFMVLLSSGVSIVAIWIIAFSILPGLFEWLLVNPNEITFERPYILNNIQFTRSGFALNSVEEKEYPLNGNFTQETVNNNPSIFTNIRLWDWKALDAVYRQFQAIRLYYEFSDVDVDRYNIDGKTRQVMVSAREINLDNLPQQSQTFVNERFQYTHGYGITMAAVNEFTNQGLPHLLIKDIPPVSESPALEVSSRKSTLVN
jgi:uncharacterized protein